VSSRCPSCSAAIVDGALRCRFCGADTRQTEPTAGIAASFSLEEVAPNAMRAARLVEELQDLAPEVLAWWRQAPRERKTRVFEILAELRELLRPAARR
jgi:hypothetical protein